MLRRGPMVGVRRGPGLLGMAARTAVVAGTATAVSGRVRQGQMDRAEQQQQAAAYEAQQEQAAMQAQMARSQAAAAAAPASGGISDESLAKLSQLAELKKQGILTDEEFATQKAKLLGI